LRSASSMVRKERAAKEVR
jgi:hypothetical protein